MPEIDKIVEQEKNRLTHIRERIKNITQEIQQKKGNISAEMFNTPKSVLTENFSPTIFSEMQNMLLETISKGYETIITEKEKIISQLQKDLENVTTKYAQLDSTLKEQIARISTLSVEKDRSVVDFLRKIAELETENKELKQKNIELLQQQETIVTLPQEDPVEIVKSHIELLRNCFVEVMRYFRNTIGIVNEAIELVKEDINGHPAGRKVLLVNQEINKVFEILQDAYNRLKIPSLNVQEVDLKSVISALMTKYQSEFVAKNVHVVHEIPTEEFKVKADFAVLVDIFSEPIVNSLEAFMQNTDNKIILKLEQNKSATEQKIVFIIEDNGHGVPEHLISKVFNLFFTTKFQIGHYGIGLFKLKWFLKMFNGCVNISSAFGKNTAVTIEFPVLNKK